MNKIIIFALLLFFNFSFSQMDSTDKKVMKMLEAIGLTETTKASIESIIKTQEEENPELIDSEYWQSFKSEKIDYSELLEMLIPIYKEHLSMNEIEKITNFYTSSAGKAMVEKFPIVAQESVPIRKAWIQKALQKTRIKLNRPLIEKYNSPTSGCSSLKEGKFRYNDFQDNQVIVNRQGDIQEEIVDGSFYKLKIEWLNDCQYKIWNYREDNNYEEVEPFVVSIYTLTNSSYKFVYKKEKGSEYLEGEMEILKMK